MEHIHLCKVVRCHMADDTLYSSQMGALLCIEIPSQSYRASPAIWDHIMLHTLNLLTFNCIKRSWTVTWRQSV